MGNIEMLEARLSRLEAQLSEHTELTKSVKSMMFQLLERQDEYPNYLSQCQLQSLLDCSRSFVINLIKDGTLPEPGKIRGKLYWKRKEVLESIDALLEKSRAEGAGD